MKLISFASIGLGKFLPEDAYIVFLRKDSGISYDKNTNVSVFSKYSFCMLFNLKFIKKVHTKTIDFYTSEVYDNEEVPVYLRYMFCIRKPIWAKIVRLSTHHVWVPINTEKHKDRILISNPIWK